jgi:hypothetical protein
MKIGKTGKLVGFVVSIAGAAALVGAAATGTGAYFSDSDPGTISGTMGTIQVNGYGGSGATGLDFNWSNILPGEWQTATVKYTNTGNNAEDVWLAFPNDHALHALNTLGKYGEMWIGGNHYTNLNDNVASCSGPACTPVPAQVKVQNNLLPGHTGQVTVKFRYATALDNSKQGLPFNCYNSSTVGSGTDTPDCPGTYGNGLPYQVVATQVGISPNDAGTKIPQP